jgi:hypothetical protein
VPIADIVDVLFDHLVGGWLYLTTLVGGEEKESISYRS